MQSSKEQRRWAKQNDKRERVGVTVSKLGPFGWYLTLTTPQWEWLMGPPRSSTRSAINPDRQLSLDDGPLAGEGC